MARDARGVVLIESAVCGNPSPCRLKTLIVDNTVVSGACGGPYRIVQSWRAPRKDLLAALASTEASEVPS